MSLSAGPARAGWVSGSSRARTGGYTYTAYAAEPRGATAGSVIRVRGRSAGSSPRPASAMVDTDAYNGLSIALWYYHTNRMWSEKWPPAHSAQSNARQGATRLSADSRDRVEQLRDRLKRADDQRQEPELVRGQTTVLGHENPFWPPCGLALAVTGVPIRYVLASVPGPADSVPHRLTESYRGRLHCGATSRFRFRVSVEFGVAYDGPASGQLVRRYVDRPQAYVSRMPLTSCFAHPRVCRQENRRYWQSALEQRPGEPPRRAPGVPAIGIALLIRPGWERPGRMPFPAASFSAAPVRAGQGRPA